MEGRPWLTPPAGSQVMHVQGNPQGVGIMEEKGTQARTHISCSCPGRLLLLSEAESRQ